MMPTVYGVVSQTTGGGGGGPATAGPNYPGTGANDASYGSTAWGNPENITADDTNYATVTITLLSTTSNYLKATNFGFNIPSGATIDGITVDIRRWKAGGSGQIRDSVVRLVKAGTVVGDNKSSSTTLPTSEVTATFGGSTDLWGTTWSASDINNTNFGVVYALERQAQNSAGAVDWITITVDYTE